ncbi:uncharacterized protein CANTADRAFT_41573, partial [Suhomyces tanzawaensis NRRL Y-17324]
KKVGEMASMFLETRKALQIDCNILDPINDNATPSVAGTEISRKTIIRAERVKSMISVKYLYIQRLYEISEQETQHPGVEDVYNPLQIIRNRKIRAKYGEYPKPLSIKTLPLASNVFSKNNTNPKKPWKMLWAIELPEIMGNLLWSRSHWHELKNAKGQLWFPAERNLSHSSSSSSAELKHRLHDKLFNDELKEESSDKKTRRRHLSSTTTSNDSDGHFFKITSSRSPMRLKDRMRKHTRKIYAHSSSSSNAGDDDDGKLGYNIPKIKDPMKDQIFKRVSTSPERSDESRPLDPTTPPAPKLRVISPTQELDVNDVRIRSVDRRIGSVDDSYEVVPLFGEDEPDSDVLAEIVKCPEPDLRVKELQEAIKNFNYFEQVISLRMNYVVNIYPHLTKSIDTALEGILNEQLRELFELTMKISDEHLPIYEQLYSGFLNEVKAINHLINDDYSIKIDNLLSTSDRSIGEINTSLSLELRKINERIDKLNSSLFSNNVVTETFKDAELSLKLKNGNNYKILYSALENLIVILLKFIWVIVNIYKFFAYLVKLVIRMFRFLL